MHDAESSTGKPPSAKKRVMPCPINDLADEDLLSILKHLSPYERLIASEVCRRWNELSRVPWRDIVNLDLSSIPNKSIGAIIKRCPSLQNVFAADKAFSVAELYVLSRVHLSSLKLYGCSCDFAPVGEILDIFSALLYGHPTNASWDELVLFDLNVTTMKGYNAYQGQVNVCTLPVSLKRLQLSDLGMFEIEEDDCGSEGDLGDGDLPEHHSILADLGRLQNLTCLILSSLSANCAIAEALDDTDLYRELPKLQNLRELCIAFAMENWMVPENAVGTFFGLPQLKVLFLHNVVFEFQTSDFVKLTTKHPTLHILVIAGAFGGYPSDYTIPARRLYPDGFSAPPVPLLHIFVGRRASETIQFTKSPPDALRIYPISAALPEFLGKEEIVPIFENVWIAAQVKEGAQFGQKLWKYYGDAATSFRLLDE